LNTLDIIISVLLLIGIIRGFIRGFIFEIALLGTIFLCYFLGFKFASFIGEYLSGLFSVNHVTMHYISLFVAWIGISIGIFFIAKLLQGLIEIVAMGIFNKIAGALFGGFKYAVILSVFFFFFNRFEFSGKWINADAKAESQLYYPILKIANVMLPMFD
jgi:membrane protein required for colicin V production